MPVTPAVTASGVRHAAKKPLKMHSGSSHIASGYPHAAVTTITSASALFRRGTRRMILRPRGLRRPAVSARKPIGQNFQQNTLPRKNESTRSGTPSSSVQPTHSRAASAPKRFRRGLSRGSTAFTQAGGTLVPMGR